MKLKSASAAILLLPLFAATAAPLPTANWSTNLSPAKRSRVALAYDAYRKQTVLFGGDNAAQGGSTFGDTWIWDGARWVQKFPQHSPPARYYAAMVFDAFRQNVVLFGGRNENGVLADTWTWDGTDWTQQHPVNSPSLRFSHAMVYDAIRGETVMFGGIRDLFVMQDTWVWTGYNWVNKQIAPANSPPMRFTHSLAFDLVRGQVVLFGGSNLSTPSLGDTWVWNGSSWTAKAPAASPPARSMLCMAYDDVQQQVVVFGGFGTALLGDTWSWDGVNWTQSSPALSPSPREDQSMVYDWTRGKLVLFGGSTNSDVPSDTWEWDAFTLTPTWTQKALYASPPARTGSAMVWDGARGQIVLFGGSAGGQLSDTWTWTGQDWTQKTPASSPPARTGHAMAFDAARGKVVLFGGFGSSARLGDTWLWDGTTWTQQFPAHTPNPRLDHAMAFDAAHSQVVLFGGQDSDVLADTWVWDGSDWSQKAPVTSPGARVSHSMVYDLGRSQTLLFGGDGDFVHFGDTWTWDGTNWTEKTITSSPSARYGQGMAYDPAHGQTVLFGGYTFLGFTSANYHGDTWTWDGANWTLRSPANTPSPRYQTAMAFDEAHGQAILFGGNGGAQGLGDSWNWDGGLLATSGGFLYSRVSHTYVGTLSVKNVSAQAVAGPFSVVIRNLPAGVTLAGPSGTYNGTSFVTVAATTLAAGQSATIQVQFNAPFPSQITFSTESYFGAHP